MLVQAHLAATYPNLPDVAGFPDRYQRSFQLEAPDYDPQALQPIYGDRIRDAVTMSLQAQGVWEAHETLAAVDVLSHHAGLVLDFGAHVGWYSILASLFGDHPVIAWEDDPEIADFLHRNLARHGVAASVQGRIGPGGTDFIPSGHQIALVKIDLEGMDCWAVDWCADLFKSGRVAAALIEVSPIFEHDGRGPCSYVDLVGQLVSWGYWPHQIPPKGWDRLDEYREAPIETLRRYRALGDNWADVITGCRQDNFMFLPV